ncbi:MAG TPA: tetratricopeptide repeat protein [Gemmataceae bacterium]|nr:tetratricopeptide repeat protein [Gemmataceae bacterium]
MNRRRRLLLISFLLLLIAAGLYVPFHSWRTHARLRSAREALAAQQFDRAREHLLAFLETQPNSAEGHLLLARACRRGGRLDEAEVALDVCELLRVPAEDVALERALITVQQGDLSLEGELQAQVEAGHPESPRILEALVGGYRKNYLLRSMLSALGTWLEREPGCVEALLLRGWVHEQQKNYEAAVEDYRLAVESDPGHDQARLHTAQALLLAGKPGEAVATFEELHRRKADPRAALGLAQCWRQLGRTAQARQLLQQQAAEQPGDFPVLLELGQLLLETGHAADAETWLRKALKRSPHDYQAHYSLAASLGQQGKLDEERKIQARTQELRDDLAHMAELMEKLQAQPNDAALRYDIARVFLRSGEEKEGVLWLQSALRANPSYKPAHRALADYYEKTHRPSLAARHRQLSR